MQWKEIICRERMLRLQKFHEIMSGTGSRWRIWRADSVRIPRRLVLPLQAWKPGLGIGIRISVIPSTSRGCHCSFWKVCWLQSGRVAPKNRSRNRIPSPGTDGANLLQLFDISYFRGFNSALAAKKWASNFASKLNGVVFRETLWLLKWVAKIRRKTSASERVSMNGLDIENPEQSLGGNRCRDMHEFFYRDTFIILHIDATTGVFFCAFCRLVYRETHYGR
jgi:hypothetical protein